MEHLLLHCISLGVYGTSLLVVLLCTGPLAHCCYFQVLMMTVMMIWAMGRIGRNLWMSGTSRNQVQDGY